MKLQNFIQLIANNTLNPNLLTEFKINKKSSRFSPFLAWKPYDC